MKPLDENETDDEIEEIDNDDNHGHTAWSLNGSRRGRLWGNRRFVTDLEEPLLPVVPEEEAEI